MSIKKILIVDDEPDVLELLETRLISAGYEVYKAGRADEAISMAKEYSPSLILMDIVLPDHSGPDVVKMFQDDPLIGKVPVLFLSGIVSKEEVEEGLQTEDKTVSSVTVGGEEFRAIPKPFIFDDLLREVKKILDESPA